VVGAEALIRWRDPELGDVAPTQFIPVAEETGFIVAIGDWVLSQALRQAALWHERGHDIPIAVNVSALQFQQAHFVDRVASVLAVTGLPPHLLELELTESILVRDADEALARLHALSRLGLQLAIDDFGTGYSSLAYLKRFPIEKLKIDRSFVKGLPDDDSDAGIVRAILQMARALDMQVIAEGVETEAQRQFLLAEGCALFQGFLYSPAVDPRTFEERLCGRQGIAGD
jgi:EAL domain-containing protein (putative c-di-GMP-specific phosphodiesterase class I)